MYIYVKRKPKFALIVFSLGLVAIAVLVLFLEYDGSASKDAAGSYDTATANTTSDITATAEINTSAQDVAQPQISAETAVLIDAASGEVIFDKRMNAHMYPASTTKILTALIAIETLDINETAEISENAAKQEGSSIYLEPGEKVSIKDLLYGMMLRSGNDAAVAVAEASAKDTDEFAKLMNERAKSLGLTNSNFTNPSGLQDENHYTSAYDMAAITREALKNETFRKIVSTKTYNAFRSGSDAYNYFYNKNKTMFQYEGATGVKIGYTTTAGRCLVASAKRDGTEFIAVVFNDRQWFDDAYELLDYGFEKYESVCVAKAGTPLTSCAVMQGDSSTVKIGAKRDVTCLKVKGEKSDISIVYEISDAVKAPVKRWDAAGKIDVYSSGEYVYSEDLYYLEDIQKR